MSQSSILFVSVAAGGGLLLILSLFLSPGEPTRETYTNRLTRLFLIFLRLAIGWHFVVEGWEKVNEADWSSRAYLHASTGPLAPKLRAMADKEFLAQLKLAPESYQQAALVVAGEFGKLIGSPLNGPLLAASGLHPTRLTALPADLNARWDKYLQIFAEEMVRTGKNKEEEKKILAVAKIKLDHAKGRTLLWLISPKLIDLPSPVFTGGRPTWLTVPERIRRYQSLLNQAYRIAEKKNAALDETVRLELTPILNEARQIYASLQAELRGQNDLMKKDLQSTIKDPVQKRLAMPALPPAEFAWEPMKLADIIIPWALCVVGVCLIVGLFTRLNCFLGAVFLLMIYLAMMPLPGWPVNPRAEGNYLFIDKNLVELLALLVLATTRSGHWLGLDALIRLPFRRRRHQPDTESLI